MLQKKIGELFSGVLYSLLYLLLLALLLQLTNSASIISQLQTTSSWWFIEWLTVFFAALIGGVVTSKRYRGAPGWMLAGGVFLLVLLFGWQGVWLALTWAVVYLLLNSFYVKRVLQQQFAGLGITMRDMPWWSQIRLQLWSPFQFATWRIADPPYHFHYYVDLFNHHHRGRGRLLLALDGHGVNSHAFHYYRAQRGVSIVLQLRYGGIYMDNERAASEIQQALRQVESIFSLVRNRDVGGMLIAGSDFYGSGYATGTAPGMIELEEGVSPQQILEKANRQLREQIGGEDDRGER